MICPECGRDFDPYEESGETSWSCPECNWQGDPGSLADQEYDARTDAAYDEVKEERAEKL